MNKHTQGDWKLEKTMIGTVVVSHGYVVSEIVGISDADYANAHLIAAAPDMLEALTQVLHDLDCMGKISDSAEIKSRAAIAKATGD